MEKLFDTSHALPNQLANLIAQANTQQLLLNKLRALLPPVLKNSLLNSLIEQENLILLVTNPAVLNRLRLHQHQLLACVKEEHKQVNTINFKLAPQGNTSIISQTPRPTASPQTTNALAQLADQLDDPALSASLHKLSFALIKHRNTQS